MGYDFQDELNGLDLREHEDFGEMEVHTWGMEVHHEQIDEMQVAIREDPYGFSVYEGPSHDLHFRGTHEEPEHAVESAREKARDIGEFWRGRDPEVFQDDRAQQDTLEVGHDAEATKRRRPKKSLASKDFVDDREQGALGKQAETMDQDLDEFLEEPSVDDPRDRWF